MNDVDGRVLVAPPGWPGPPDPAAWSGTAGAIAETIAPHTEADPVAVLAQLLVGAGAMDRAEPGFAARVRTGLSTGEGLIWAARDPDGADPGAHDPRLLVVEPEFVTVLKAIGRDVNTLSPVLRAAWDSRPLALLTRTAPARASAAHIAVIGHITGTELAHHTSAVEAANGFLNRFCFIACRRHRLLPDGGDPDPLAGTGLEKRLGAHLATARRAGHVHLESPWVCWRLGLGKVPWVGLVVEGSRSGGPVINQS